jgi:hypothetical protein
VYDFSTAEYSDAIYELDTDYSNYPLISEHVKSELTHSSQYNPNVNISVPGWKVHESRLRAGRSSHAAVTYRGRIWVAGGILEGQYCEGNSSVEIYDPKIGYWLPGPALKMRRFRLLMFVIS